MNFERLFSKKAIHRQAEISRHPHINSLAIFIWNLEKADIPPLNRVISPNRYIGLHIKEFLVSEWFQVVEEKLKKLIHFNDFKVFFLKTIHYVKLMQSKT